MGVESALLAQRGYSGPEHIIDGKEGLFAVFGHVNYKGAPAKFDADKLVGSLPSSRGDSYKIIDCGMKSFPIEALSHGAADGDDEGGEGERDRAARGRRDQGGGDRACRGYSGGSAQVPANSKETADHSLPYCMAVGLVDGMVTPLQFKEERVMDPSLIPVMDKVKVVPNEEFEALFPKFQPSRVTIATSDGREHSKRVDVPKGDPRDPMTEEEIGVKFNALGKEVVGEARCRELGKQIMSMETWKNVETLMRLMTAGEGEARSNGTTREREEAILEEGVEEGAAQGSRRPPRRSWSAGADTSALWACHILDFLGPEPEFEQAQVDEIEVPVQVEVACGAVAGDHVRLEEIVDGDLPVAVDVAGTDGDEHLGAADGRAPVGSNATNVTLCEPGVSAPARAAIRSGRSASRDCPARPAGTGSVPLGQIEEDVDAVHRPVHAHAEGVVGALDRRARVDERGDGREAVDIERGAELAVDRVAAVGAVTERDGGEVVRAFIEQR